MRPCSTGTENARGLLRSSTSVELQEPAESLVTFDRTAIVVGDDIALVDELVLQPLMWALNMIVSREFVDRCAKVPLAERDHLVQTF